MNHATAHTYLTVNRKTCIVVSDYYVNISGTVMNIYDLERSDFYTLIKHLLKKDIVTFISDFKDDIRYHEVILIPSVINISEGTFHESITRSIFTPAERFEQTLESVKSSKPCPSSSCKDASDLRSSGSPVFLLEGSRLSISQIQRLSDAGVSRIILCCEGVTDILANKSKNKSMYELYLFYELLPKITADVYIKLGGRYRIFERQRFSREKACFKPVRGFGPGEIIECIHYSIPHKMKETFVEIYKEFMQIISQNETEAIENLFTRKLFSNMNLWTEMKFLGIVGNDAILGREYVL